MITFQPPSFVVVFNFVQEFITLNGYAPTVQEIGDACFMSKNTAFHHLNKLVERGWIEKDAKTPRGLRITRKKPQ